MDWFSWLSRTNLEPSLIYEYGLSFARNELQLEDAIHFNHEFLQSMGISIAKHRLEILKLAKKQDEEAKGGKKLSGVIRKCLKKCFELGSRHKVAVLDEPNWCQGSKWRRARCNNNNNGSDEIKGESNKGVQRSRNIALSGPLDGRMLHEKILMNNRMMKLSGPLDGKLMYANANKSPLMSATTTPTPLDGRFMGSVKSPRLSGPLDARPTMVCNRSPRLARPLDERAESPIGYSSYNKDRADYDDDYALWSTLFEDLKPT
ncbi:hypothetical protein VNO78_03111 [Psophocarpus tetragonolobus]|uniref:SAM domain-containing protein n=1 Tax=Psophocarpus tetragonolobus TaxID=3891 RepID=A0AAN9XVB6_PSOTE